MIIFLAISSFITNVCSCLWFHRRGFKRGLKEGYDTGFAIGKNQSDNWWLGVEQQVEQERQNIGKEKA